MTALERIATALEKLVTLLESMTIYPELTEDSAALRVSQYKDKEG